MSTTTKTKLFYFSGTGNSYAIARDLQKKMKDCELVSITSVINQEKISVTADKIGIIFPLYFISLPKIVRDFVLKLEAKTDYIFAVVTRGGRSYQGNALHDLKKLLTKKGSKLDSGFYIRMPDNYLPMLKVPPKDLQEKMFKEAAEKLPKIIETVNSNKLCFEREYTAFISPLVSKPFINRVNQMDKSFHSTTGCNSCGLCAKACHLGNITMKEGKPCWNHNCQMCLACINYCPKRAIEYKKASVGKERYNHPEVDIKTYIGI